MELNRIYNEDCLEGIGRIPTGSIQTVICDPPYFCGMTHNGRTNGEMVHPTQKPVELIARLITDSTAEGDTVLDCFMGSGTTAVAALRTGRRFVGFEIDENYHAIALRRIEQERAQLKIEL